MLSPMLLADLADFVTRHRPAASSPATRRARGVRLLDHLIRTRQQRRRDRQAECLGGLEVDDEVELGGLLDGMSAGLAPLRILSTYVAARRYTSAVFDP
jgi:hypothetical protein